MNVEDVISNIQAEKDGIAKLTADLAHCKTRLHIFKTTKDGMGCGGSATRKLSEKIENETAAMVEIEGKITESKARLSAYEELVKILPKDQNFKLREGSEIAKVEQHIRSAKTEVPLDEIVKAIAKDGDDLAKKKKSLRGTIRAYVRDGKVFDYGAAPDTFTLIEFKCLDSQANGHQSN